MYLHRFVLVPMTGLPPFSRRPAFATAVTPMMVFLLGPLGAIMHALNRHVTTVVHVLKTLTEDTNVLGAIMHALNRHASTVVHVLKTLTEDTNALGAMMILTQPILA